MQPSKSEKKRQAKAIEQLVIELAGLSSREIEALPCDREIKEEIAAAADLKGSARKRQLKYATKLLRDRPVEPLYNFLAQTKGSRLKEKQEFHELEQLRNLLLDEAVQSYEERRDIDDLMPQNEPTLFLANSRSMASIAAQLPEVDVALLKDTARQFARTRNRKYSRELFRMLRAAREKEQLLKKTEE